MPRKKKEVQEKFPYEASAIIGVEDIYAVINFVQVTRKSCSFFANPTDSTIMENLLKDCEISFKRAEVSKKTKYQLTPPPVREIPEEVFIIDEQFDDEIIEDGQCF